MANRDRYDMDILKALQKIGNSLDKIEKILEAKSTPSFIIESNDDQGRGFKYRKVMNKNG